MNIVNLFAGHGTWVAPWREELGHNIWTTDIVARPGIEHVADLMDVTVDDIPFEPGTVDLFVASPDCTAFSVASIGTHWTGGRRAYVPATEKAKSRLALVNKMMELNYRLAPHCTVIENPRGMLRKLSTPLNNLYRDTVWYCHYGDERAKPTDIWTTGMLRLYWDPAAPCHNRRKGHERPCCCFDHETAPRGAKTGTQGREKDARSFIPYALAAEIKEAVKACRGR